MKIASTIDQSIAERLIAIGKMDEFINNWPLILTTRSERFSKSNGDRYLASRNEDREGRKRFQ